MPYQAGKRLPGERASKIGHLDVLKSGFVKDLISSFEAYTPQTATEPSWALIETKSKPLSIVFGIDGSYQPIPSEEVPYREIAFVKTALLRIDERSLSKIDKDAPHPMALRDLMQDSAIHHSTAFPLKNVTIPGYSTYDAVRRILYESLKDKDLEGQVMETLKWIVYEKWDENEKELPKFECPHCSENLATLPYDAELGNCPNCKKEIYITDMLGFHQVMLKDSAPEEIARDYMTIHETLLLFTGVRFFWERNKKLLSECLFVKDGPLSIRAQYSKLVAPIRRFLDFAKKNGVEVHIVGQEKSGAFFDHLQMIRQYLPNMSYFLPDDKYIRSEVQGRPDKGQAYGKDTNWGAKLFLRLTDYDSVVLNVPTGSFNQNPLYTDLIGIDRIMATIPRLLSHRYEGALLPVQLANNIASLSTYPSAKILKIFSESSVMGG